MTDPRPLLSGYPVAPWCELGIGDARAPTGQARWDVSRWDAGDARWAGTEPTWLDRSCEVNAATSNAGRERLVDRFRPGTADITFRNVDGWADLVGAPHPPATLTLRPGRQIRYGVTTPTGRHVMFRGYVDEAVPVYQPYGTDVVVCNAIDALGECGRPTLAALVADVGAGETADVRVARLLDAIAWPPSYRDLQRTSVALLGTLFGASLADLLGETADSSAGSIFGDLAGRIAFRGRDWQTYLPDTPPAATIGNVDSGDVCPATWELAFRRRDVAAYVRMGRPDGTAGVAYDRDTALVIGPEPFVRDDLLTYYPSDLDDIAARVLETRGLATMPRVEAVTLDAAHDDGDGRYVELMATARPETPTRVRCRLKARDGRLVFDVDMFVTGVEHAIDDVGRWLCRLTLDVAAPFAAAGGRWDGAYWDRSTWTKDAP